MADNEVVDYDRIWNTLLILDYMSSINICNSSKKCTVCEAFTMLEGI